MKIIPMNFKFERFFYVAISFIFGAFFFVVGVFSIALPWSELLQNAIIRFLTENTLILSLFGLGFALIGLSIFIYTAISTKHRYTFIKTGNRSISIDENLIEQYLKSYWKEQFSQSEVPFQLMIRKNFLQVAADLPAMPEEDQKNVLEKINRDFSYLFGEVLGYPHEVHLIASFNRNLGTK
ncbi:hypothetical protein DB44_CW00480 [Candidatus Protochlamydia amoebophila]|uniref:Uncharacterized protein n=2 Tax=Parachlamydiaceae TaxID=92713 RepID=A0A0C1JKQ7_9BACT|nr:hypothetical protein DB44_CW00480 [Candidatus Protochlamydia amoebophila]